MKRPAIYLALCWIIGYILTFELSMKLSGWFTVVLIILLLISWVIQIPGRAWISFFLVMGIAASYSHWVDAQNHTQVIPLPSEAEQISGMQPLYTPQKEKIYSLMVEEHFIFIN